MNSFPVNLRLYNSCRRAGVWARMGLEAENGKETITVSRPSTLPEDKDWKDGGRRKKPSKVRKDHKRREAWLERRRTVEDRTVAEVTAAAPITDFAPGPGRGRTPAPRLPGGGTLVPGHPGTPGCGPPDDGVHAPAPGPPGPLAPGPPGPHAPDPLLLDPRY